MFFYTIIWFLKKHIDKIFMTIGLIIIILAFFIGFLLNSVYEQADKAVIGLLVMIIGILLREKQIERKENK